METWHGSPAKSWSSPSSIGPSRPCSPHSSIPNHQNFSGKVGEDWVCMVPVQLDLQESATLLQPLRPLPPPPLRAPPRKLPSLPVSPSFSEVRSPAAIEALAEATMILQASNVKDGPFANTTDMAVACHCSVWFHPSELKGFRKKNMLHETLAG